MSYSIDIAALPDMSAKFNINITKNGDWIKIYISKSDSIKRSVLNRNPDYISLFSKFTSLKNVDLADSTTKQLLQQLNFLENQNTAYTIDSLAISASKDPSYVQLLDSVVNSPMSILDKKDPKKFVLFIHPTRFLLTIKGGAIPNRSFYITQPTYKYQPLISNIITVTLDKYRSLHPNSFIDKKYTRGY